MMDKDEFDYVKDVLTELAIMRADLATAKDRLNWLDCLEAAGVDNWEGIDYAHELYKEGYDE